MRAYLHRVNLCSRLTTTTSENALIPGEEKPPHLQQARRDHRGAHQPRGGRKKIAREEEMINSISGPCRSSCMPQPGGH